MALHNDFGVLGEKLACQFLRGKNYDILEKNWRFKKAEIDIIAKKNNTLAILEVKSRSSTYFGNPQDFVSPKKIKLLVEAANEYIMKNNLDIEVRFDIIAIVGNSETYTIKHLKDAFYHF